MRRQISEILKAGSIPDPYREAGLLLSYVLGVEKAKLVTAYNVSLSGEQAARLISFAHRRAAGEPYAYIVRKCGFMSLEFEVTPDVLIPRPDTEVLVEDVLERLRSKREPSSCLILDIGTGSGAIAVSLAKYDQDARIYGIDISAAALKVARRNAKRHGVDERAEFGLCDIMQGFPDFGVQFDIVVSNPPYVRRGDLMKLERGVREYEPYTALDGGLDGLDFYRRIAACSTVAPGGLLALEVGYDQAEAVGDIIAKTGKYENINYKKDLSGIIRVVSAQALPCLL